METIKVKVYPSRISLKYHNPETVVRTAFNNKLNSYYKKQLNNSYIENFKKENNPFILSKASKRKLFDTINYIYTLSNKRNIKMANGSTLFNFKASFITLTLPSKQLHNDTLIKNKCLNQLFIELKKHYKMSNYIWRAELQSNQNIHFHIITDSYIDYQALRRRWNRILNKLDYVNRYKEKMSSLSLNEYYKLRRKHSNLSFNDAKEAYIKGKKSNWSNPNSVDIRSITNKKSMLSYLSKYISKNKNDSIGNDTLIERQKSFGRSWSRSQSLSKIKGSLTFSYKDFKNVIEYMSTKCKDVFIIDNPFCKVLYYDISKLPKNVSSFLLNYIKFNSNYYNYAPT